MVFAKCEKEVMQLVKQNEIYHGPSGFTIRETLN
jgi:hypothetical protein